MKGTSEQIKIACGIIEDIVKEEVDFREQIKESAESRSFRSSRRPRQRQNNDKQPLFLTSDSHIEEEESGQNFVKPKSQTEELNDSVDDSMKKRRRLSAHRKLLGQNPEELFLPSKLRSGIK